MFCISLRFVGCMASLSKRVVRPALNGYLLRNKPKVCFNSDLIHRKQIGYKILNAIRDCISPDSGLTQRMPNHCVVLCSADPSQNDVPISIQNIPHLR